MQPYLPVRYALTTADAIDDPNVFPMLAGQSFLTAKSPQWSTGRTTSVAGRERRRALWSYPRWNFSVSYEVIRDTPSIPELRKLLAFFNAHLGGYAPFLFLDKSDHQAVGAAFGTGDGVTTTFQLTRTIAVGAITATEPVRALNGTPTVYANGSPISAFTVGAGGQITFATAPAVGAALTWSGQFFFQCVFDADKLDVVQMMQGLWSNAGLPFHSVKA